MEKAKLKISGRDQGFHGKLLSVLVDGDEASGFGQRCSERNPSRIGHRFSHTKKSSWDEAPPP